MIIRDVGCDAERREIYHLRYRINVLEQRRTSPFADHDQLSVVDPLDRHSTHIAAWVRNELVGAVRLSLLSAVDLDYMASMLPASHLASMNIETCSLTSRLMVAPHQRGSTLALRLARATYRAALRQEVHHDYIVCSPHLESFFTRLGYESMDFQSNHPEAGPVSAHLLDLRDLARLDRVRSPFASDLRSHESESNDNPETRIGVQS